MNNCMLLYRYTERLYKKDFFWQKTITLLYCVTLVGLPCNIKTSNNFFFLYKF